MLTSFRKDLKRVVCENVSVTVWSYSSWLSRGVVWRTRSNRTGRRRLMDSIWGHLRERETDRQTYCVYSSVHVTACKTFSLAQQALWRVENNRCHRGSETKACGWELDGGAAIQFLNEHFNVKLLYPSVHLCLYNLQRIMTISIFLSVIL